MTDVARPLTEVPAALRTRLAVLAPAQLEITDDSAAHVGHAGAAGGAGHFSLLVVSEAFSGLSRLARHQRVLARAGRPATASDSRAVHQRADAGRIFHPTTKDVSSMTRHSLTLALAATIVALAGAPALAQDKAAAPAKAAPAAPAKAAAPRFQ